MGMFSKEMAITLPLTICLYEFCFLRTKNRFTWKYIVPFFAIALVMPLTILITKSVDVQSMRRIGEDAPELSSGQYFLTQLRVMATYIRLMLLPINQNLDYYYPALDSILQIPVILSLLLMLFILSIAFKLLKNYRLISFSIFWFFITLLPESSVIPIRDVMVEHRLYLPMLGFSFFLVSGLYYLFKQKSVKLKVTILLLLVICYSVMTYQRNRVWKDEFSLWTDTVRKSPLKARPYLSRGLAYQMKGDFDQALSDFGKVIEINPNNAEAAEAYYDRGLLYENKGELEQSILEYNKAIKLRPNLAKAYNNRAIVYQKKGDLNQALLDYNKAIEIDPGYVEAYYNRGIIYQIKGDLTRAISDYNKAIEIYPNLAAAYTNRAIAYQMKGDFSQALFDYNKAIEIDPNNTQAYYNRAVMYFEKQQYAKSWEDVHKAQVLGYQVNPKFIEQLKKLSGREK
jgi:tetratricopeptide (TPR) repeat protein